MAHPGQKTNAMIDPTHPKALPAAREVLSVVPRDVPVSTVYVAQQLGITQETAYRRMRKLENAGFLTDGGTIQYQNGGAGRPYRGFLRTDRPLESSNGEA